MEHQAFLEQHLRHSKAVDTSDIDWEAVPRFPLRDDEIQILSYFMDVESNTIIYLKELLSTPAAHDPQIQAFLSCWAYEELFHGHAIKRFLQAYGVPVDEARTVVNAEKKPFWAYLFLIGQTLLSRWAGARFIGVHMAWGATNELATAEGYLRIIRRTEHPILKTLLTRIMKDERRHFAFYYQEAQSRLADPKTARLVSTLIRRFFEPVGADIRSKDEVDAVSYMLFGDAEGQTIVRGIDEKIAQLPGLAGFHGALDALERTRRRYEKRLPLLGRPQASEVALT